MSRSMLEITSSELHNIELNAEERGEKRAFIEVLDKVKEQIRAIDTEWTADGEIAAAKGELNELKNWLDVQMDDDDNVDNDVVLEPPKNK